HYQHAHQKQSCRRVTQAPVMQRDCSGAARGQQHCTVEQPGGAERWNEQHEYRQQTDGAYLQGQQPLAQACTTLLIEIQNEAQQENKGQQHRNVGNQGLIREQDWRTNAKQSAIGQRRHQQCQMQSSQAEVAIAATTAETQQVVDQQQRQGAKQRAEQVGVGRLSYQAGFVDKFKPGQHHVIGLQPYIGGPRFAVVGQSENVGAIGQRAGAERAQLAGGYVALQLGIA